MSGAHQGAVVVPAIGTAGSLSVVRSLGRHGVSVICVADRESPPSTTSRYCAETIAVPSPDEDLHGYRDALLELARRSDVRTIIPVREADVYVLSKHRDAFAEHIGTPWPTFETLSAVHDRMALFDAAENADVTVPETTLLDEVQNWDREQIVKGRHAFLTPDIVEQLSPGRSDAPPKTIFLEPGVEPDVQAIIDRMGHVPIAQGYRRGTEYCLRALYQDGEVLVTSQKKLIRGYKYARGPSVYHEAVDIPELEAAGVALLDELDWHGMASVGFIRDSSGAFNLLEVNPRIPASIPIDIHAGVDYPVYIWKLAGEEETSIRTRYRPGIASHMLRGEVVHLHSVLFEDYPLAVRPSLRKTVWNIATSLVQQPRFDYLSLDDPAPFVSDSVSAGRDLLSRL